jgi:hypothetical protein
VAGDTATSIDIDICQTKLQISFHSAFAPLSQPQFNHGTGSFPPMAMSTAAVVLGALAPALRNKARQQPLLLNLNSSS